MKIIQSKQFKFQFNDYSLLNIKREYPISYIAIFFYDAFPYIYRSKVKNFIEKLNTIYKEGMNFEMIELCMDYQNNLAYINEPFYISTKEITPEIDQLIEDQNAIELCRRNFMGYTTMTIENLFHLFLTWEKLIDNKTPFILLYLDDNNWYDAAPFNSQEAMEKFVADHTEQKTNQK